MLSSSLSLLVPPFCQQHVLLVWPGRVVIIVRVCMQRLSAPPSPPRLATLRIASLRIALHHIATRRIASSSSFKHGVYTLHVFLSLVTTDSVWASSDLPCEMNGVWGSLEQPRCCVVHLLRLMHKAFSHPLHHRRPSCSAALSHNHGVMSRVSPVQRPCVSVIRASVWGGVVCAVWCFRFVQRARVVDWLAVLCGWRVLCGLVVLCGWLGAGCARSWSWSCASHIKKQNVHSTSHMQLCLIGQVLHHRPTDITGKVGVFGLGFVHMITSTRSLRAQVSCASQDGTASWPLLPQPESAERCCVAARVCRPSSEPGMACTVCHSSTSTYTPPRRRAQLPTSSKHRPFWHHHGEGIVLLLVKGELRTAHARFCNRGG